MSELYGDDYDPVAAGDRLVPDRMRRLAGALLFLGLIAALGFWAYRLGARDAAEVPIIRAMEGPARVQPDDPGGLTAAHQGLEVNAVLAGEPAPEPTNLAPPTPPAPLAEEDGPQGELLIAEPAVLPEEALAAGEDLRMPQGEDALALGSPPDAAAAAPDAPLRSSGPIDTAALVAAALGAAPPSAEAQEAATLAEPEAGAPEPADARPLRRPADLPRVRAAAAPTVGASSVATATAAAAPATREATGLGTGTRLVQLGAYDSEAITREAWSRLVGRHGDLLGPKSLYVERTTANARVFYRLRVAGFATSDETRAMCEALRARGVDCIPVTLQ